MALIGIGAGALGKAIGGGLGTRPAFDPYALMNPGKLVALAPEPVAP